MTKVSLLLVAVLAGCSASTTGGGGPAIVGTWRISASGTDTYVEFRGDQTCGVVSARGDVASCLTGGCRWELDGEQLVVESSQGTVTSTARVAGATLTLTDSKGTASYERAGSVPTEVSRLLSSGTCRP